MNPREEARKLLKRAGVKAPPVPVEKLARAEGATIKWQPFPGQLSGMLAKSPSGWMIGVNSLDAGVRQRFTIAHEIGHLVLHKKHKDIFVDSSPYGVSFRGPQASRGNDPYEVAANQFAAELLMPKEFLRADLMKEGEADGFDAEELIERLAERYRVSRQAMTIRLTGFGLGRFLGIDPSP